MAHFKPAGPGPCNGHGQPSHFNLIEQSLHPKFIIGADVLYDAKGRSSSTMLYIVDILLAPVSFKVS